MDVQIGKSWLVKKNLCPVCCANLDAVIGVGTNGDAPATAVHPGDVSVCIYCGNWLEFGPTMDLQLMSEKIIATLPEKIFQLLLKLSRAAALSRRK